MFTFSLRLCASECLLYFLNFVSYVYKECVVVIVKITLRSSIALLSHVVWCVCVYKSNVVSIKLVVLAV